jgi:hypothetical protein
LHGILKAKIFLLIYRELTFDGDYTGYRLPPGKYKAKITYKDASSEAEMNVIQDPALKVTAADWNEQQKFLNNISNEVSEIHKSIIAMRKVKKAGRNI